MLSTAESQSLYAIAQRAAGDLGRPRAADSCAARAAASSAWRRLGEQYRGGRPVAKLVYYDEPRSRSEIQPVLGKLLDQVWYNRHKNLAYEIEVGDVELVDQYRPKNHQHTVVRSVWEGALASARQMEEKWPGELGPWDDFE